MGGIRHQQTTTTTTHLGERIRRQPRTTQQQEQQLIWASQVSGLQHPTITTKSATDLSERVGRLAVRGLVHLEPVDQTGRYAGLELLQVLQRKKKHTHTAAHNHSQARPSHGRYKHQSEGGEQAQRKHVKVKSRRIADAAKQARLAWGGLGGVGGSLQCPGHWLAQAILLKKITACG